MVGQRLSHHPNWLTLSAGYAADPSSHYGTAGSDVVEQSSLVVE
jgi:hypothetical protein